MTLSEHDRGWLEGIIDGEGSLSMCKNNNNSHSKRGFSWGFSLQVGSTDKIIVDHVQKLIGKGTVHLILYTKKRLGTKPFYQFLCGANALRELLPQLTLLAKESQKKLMLKALHLISFHKHGYTPNDSTLFEIWAELRNLKSRKGRRNP